MAKQYLTVVFEHDGKSNLPKKLTKSFAENVDFEGCRITAVSLEDEISRVEKLEELSEIGE